MIVVRGAGWLNDREFGTVRLGERTIHQSAGRLETLWREHGIIESPGRNFRRVDRRSKITCSACALALRDAALSPSEREGTIGIVASDRTGCLDANVDYFRDYLESGRTLARGNLFVYTLPSSAVSEAAILFGLSGPTLSLAAPGGSLGPGLKSAAATIARGEAEAMVVARTRQDDALALVLAQAPAGRSAGGSDGEVHGEAAGGSRGVTGARLEEAIALAGASADLSRTIDGLTSLFDMKDRS